MNPKNDEDFKLYVMNHISTLKSEISAIKADLSWIKKWFAPAVILALLSMLLNLILALWRH